MGILIRSVVFSTQDTRNVEPTACSIRYFNNLVAFVRSIDKLSYAITSHKQL